MPQANLQVWERILESDLASLFRGSLGIASSIYLNWKDTDKV